MRVCVLEILVLKILNWETILRDYCVDWNIGWVVCWIAFMSVFFSPRKTILKSWLDTSSIPSGSIKNALASSIAPRHLVDRLSFCSWIWFLVPRYLLNTSTVNDHFLDTYLDSFLDTSRYLICRALLKVLFKPPSWSVSHFFDLSQSVRACSSPKHSLFHSQPLPQGFFKLFRVFLHLVSF